MREDQLIQSAHLSTENGRVYRWMLSASDDVECIKNDEVVLVSAVLLAGA